LNAFDAVVREMPSASARVWSVTRSPSPTARRLLAAVLAHRRVRERRAGERVGAGDVEDGEGGEVHGTNLSGSIKSVSIQYRPKGGLWYG
jgi:hypothetical protein